MESKKVTLRLPVDVGEKLSRLATGTNRSLSHLAAIAVAEFVDRELPVVEGIRQGLADVKVGRVSSHDDVMAEGKAMISSLRETLIAGEQSGEPRTLDFEALKARKRAERAG